MSILREVIESVEEVEWNNYNKRIPVLVNDVHLCRTEVFEILDDFYLEFIQKPVMMPQLGDKLSSFLKELEILRLGCEQGIIREINSPKKHKDFETLLDTVKRTFESCQLVSNCYQIHEMFVDLESYKNNCEKSLQLMKKIRYKMDNTESAILQRYYRKHFKLMESAVLLRFGKILNEKFIFEVKKQNTISYLRVMKHITIGNTIELLLWYFNHIKQMNDLVNFIWEFLIVPIVTCSVTMNSNDSGIELKILKKEEPYYKEVFKRLHDVNNFLKCNFNICIDSTGNVSLLDYIGNHLKGRISSLLISKCLEKISKDFRDNDSLDYENIIMNVENLVNALKTTKLITDDSLLNYVKNLEQIHQSREQNVFFTDMRNILSRKNYDIVRVGSESVDKSALPSMSISSVVQDLQQLIEKILLKEKEDRVFTDGVHNILNFFREYTSKDVEEMTSQEVALLYNNYIYISFELNSCNTLHSHVILEDNSVPLFKDESYLFQIAGEEILDHFLVKERKKLELSLNELVDENKVISCELFQTTFSKCLRQIELLAESWFGLLSKTSFNRYIGVCFDVICNFLIKFILKFDNSIDEDLIVLTSKIFNSILKLIEKYFVDVTDLNKFINCWSQFEALSYVLKFDLVEIQINKLYEPLKSNFNPSVVKQIFKAIFVESERRNAFLLDLYS